MPTPDPSSPGRYLVTPGKPAPEIRPGQRWRSCEAERRNGTLRVETVAEVIRDARGAPAAVVWARPEGARRAARVNAASLHLDGQARAQGWLCETP